MLAREMISDDDDQFILVFKFQPRLSTMGINLKAKRKARKKNGYGEISGEISGLCGCPLYFARDSDILVIENLNLFRIISLMKPSTPSHPQDDPNFITYSRSSSVAVKKRARETETNGKSRIARRTKSTGDAREGRNAREREVFQRGLIAVFVPNALKEIIQGKTAHYNELLAHFIPIPLTPDLPPLLPLLRALTAHVSLLSPDFHSTLVTAIISLPWATGDDKFVKTFVGWAGVLVTAHPHWAREVMTMAVKGLTWR